MHDVPPVALQKKNMALLCSRCRGSGVEAEEQTITCVVLEGGPCSPCKEREVIRGQIEQLEEEITKLKAKHHARGGGMNAIHDPFIHKLPPEIGSHIFCLFLPTLDFEDFDLWNKAATFTRVMRLGAVCRKWRQLAWTTPDLWDTIFLKIKPSTSRSLAESLPGLLREWLSRSGLRPLTIFFQHFGCSEESDYSPSNDEFSDESAANTLESATGMVIEIINLYSGRWQSLHLDVGAADISERLCGSVQPNNQLFGLDLQVSGKTSPTQKFVMKTKPFPTQLTLFNFSPTSIDIGWDNITHASLCSLSANECLDVLRRAPALEYCVAEPRDDDTVNFVPTILNSRLLSLNFTSRGTKFLDAINVPSLEEWVQNTDGGPLSVTAMVSLLERSGCCLKILSLQHISAPPDNLSILFEAMPSLERLQLHFYSVKNADGVMDDILARIFNSPPGNSTIPSEEASRESFLPHLQFMECIPLSYATFAPFSWNHIPQLYRQGHRRSLTLRSTADESHISDGTALQLLKLIDEGVDLQICDKTTKGGGDFLENFRKKLCSLSSTNLSKWK